MYGLYILLLHFHFTVELETREDNCLLSNEPVALISFSLRILEVVDVCYGLHCVPLKFKRWNSNFSPHNATVFGDSFFKEVMKKKWGHREPGSNLTLRRGHTDTLAQRENRDKTLEEGAPFRAQKRDPQEKLILILSSYPSELWENKFLFFKSPRLWYFVMTALAN